MNDKTTVVLYMTGLGHEDYITVQATDAELVAWKRFERLMGLCCGCGSPCIKFYGSMLALVKDGNARCYSRKDNEPDQDYADRIELVPLPGEEKCVFKKDIKEANQ